MKIGLISYDFFPILGGQGKNFYELSKRLFAGSTENEVKTFSPCRNQLKQHQSILPFTKSCLLGQLIFSFLLNFKLEKLVKDHQLDLLIFNGGPGGVLLFRKQKLPIVYVVNHTYKQQVSFLKSESWKKIFIPFEVFSYRLASRLIAISEATKKSLTEEYKFRSEIIEQIYIGVDQSFFTNRNCKRTNNIILFVGRIEERKGARTLLAAFKRLSKEHPKLRLLIVGEGRLEQELRGFVQDNLLTDQVEFLGFVSDDKLKDLYQKSSVFVLPSKGEGLGIAAIEASASGLPAVVSRVPGLSEVVEDRKNGLLVPVNNVYRLSEAISELLEGEALYDSCSIGARLIAEDKFSWDAIIKSYEQLIVSTYESYRAR